jgi:hypothetical protein
MAITFPHGIVIDGVWSSSGMMIIRVKPETLREKSTPFPPHPP